MRTAGIQNDEDWAWRPPSGRAEPGESDEACAQRELLEETGLQVPVTRVAGTAYPTFVVEQPANSVIALSGEHDALEWLAQEELIERCRPDVVSLGIAEALDILGR